MSDLDPLPYTADGVAMIGRIARPTGPGPHPAILIAHEIDGLGTNVRNRARQLADLGYVALAADLYGGGEVYDRDEGRAHGYPLLDDRAQLRRRARGGLDALAALPEVDASRIAATGYCFGGATVLELARDNAPVQAVVSFHGLLSTPMSATSAIAPRILVCHGDADPLVPPDQVAAFEAEMRAVDADWQLFAFGRARHAFTIPGVGVHAEGALSHDPSADRQSWAAAALFLEESLIR